MANPANTPGVNVVGTLLNDPELFSGKSKATGNDFHNMSYMVLCGNQIVRVTQFSDSPVASPLKMGQMVRVSPQASGKDNGVIVMNGSVDAVE